MKLIVEQQGGTVYVYREKEAHHQTVQPAREKRSRRLDPNLLDEECNIAVLGDFHMVFALKS